MKTISFPLKDEYTSYYGTYLGYVEKVTDILAFAEAQIAEVRSLFGSFTAVLADFGQWGFGKEIYCGSIRRLWAR